MRRFKSMFWTYGICGCVERVWRRERRRECPRSSCPRICRELWKRNGLLHANEFW